MSRKKIVLSQVKDVLNYDRSVSRTANILKYIALFLDQREIGPKLVQNTLQRLKSLKDKKITVNENIIVQAFKCELDKLLKGTKYWDALGFVQQLTAVKQILSMSAVNKLLYGVITKQVDIKDYVDEEGFLEFTKIIELTKGQLWNLKMKEAKKRKAEERKLAAKAKEEAKVEEKVKDVKNSVEDAFSFLSEYLTEEEIAEIRELNELKF